MIQNVHIGTCSPASQREELFKTDLILSIEIRIYEMPMFLLLLLLLLLLSFFLPTFWFPDDPNRNSYPIHFKFGI